MREYFLNFWSVGKLPITDDKHQVSLQGVGVNEFRLVQMHVPIKFQLTGFIY